MKRRVLTLFIILFWLFSMAWLVCFEAFPGFFSHASTGYRALFSEGLLIMDRWMKISFKGSPIGYSHTSIDVNEDAPVSQYLVDNRTVLNLKIMGQQRQVRVRVHATVDAMFCLEDFFFALASGSHSVAINGVRIGEEVFDVTIRTGGSSQQTQVRIPDDAVIYSPVAEMAMQQLKPGQQMKIRTFNPVSMTAEEIVVKALRREAIRVGDEKIEAIVLAADYHGMEMVSWLDDQGQVLRQETPFGWSLEICDSEEALASLADSRGSEDIVLAMAIPVTAQVARPRQRMVLNVYLHGSMLRREDLESHRQIVQHVGADGIRLSVKRERLPAQGLPIRSIPDDYRAFLNSSSYIQANARGIVNLAGTIVGEEKDSLKAAVAIHEWVHGNMRRAPVVSVPSALEVLETMTGDCNEHTYLFVALARASGLPARIAVGIVYDEGAFYYHAWPVVYVGRWLEMDPTLGQANVDATHVKLFEGELPDQMKLLGMIGQLSVEVISP